MTTSLTAHSSLVLPQLATGNIGTEIVEHVDAVGAKVDKIKFHAKRRSKFTDAMREVCRSYWDAAQNNAEVRYAISTRITYESVFRYYAKALAKYGITTARQFKAVLHSAQNIECAGLKKKLDAQRDAPAASPSLLSRPSRLSQSSRPAARRGRLALPHQPRTTKKNSFSD